MINHLDETLRKLLLARGNFAPDSIGVSFDQPTGDWAAGLTRPTINFYLYDIRENTELRSQEWIVERNTDGQVNKRLAPWRYDLSYLITIWTQNQVEDEHAILWRVLGALASVPTLPEELLEPELASQPYPILTRTAQPSRAIENLPDLWGVMENQLRPSLNFVVTLAMERSVVFTSPWVATAQIGVRDTTEGDGSREALLQIGGTVYSRDGKEPIADATVHLVETGERTRTNASGRYQFARLSEGTYLVRVSAGEHKTERQISIPSEALDEYDIEVS